MTNLENHLTQSLRSAGMRLTPQRLAICNLLVATDSHPSAQMIYETLQPQFPTMSLATVYNTLEALMNLGVVNSLGTAGDDTIHYDADTSLEGIAVPVLRKAASVMPAPPNPKSLSAAMTFLAFSSSGATRRSKSMVART